MRSRQDTSWWCLRGQNHQTPCPPRSPQVCTMEWRRLRALLLRRHRTEPGGREPAFKRFLPSRKIFAESKNAGRASTLPPSAGFQQSGCSPTETLSATLKRPVRHIEKRTGPATTASFIRSRSAHGAQVWSNRPAVLSDLAQHWRQNSQSGRKGADQRKMPMK